MRKLIPLLFLAAALPAHAADVGMPTKAPRNAYPLDGAGCYGGVNVEAAAAQSNVSGNSLFLTSLATGNLVAAGGSVGATVGCLKGNPMTGWFAIQGSVNFTNISGSVGLGNSLGTMGVSSKWSAEQVLKVGGFAALFSFLPDLGVTFPALTVPVVAAPAGYQYLQAKPYLMAGLREFDNSGWLALDTGHSVGVAPLLGMGMITPLADSAGHPVGAVLDTYAKVSFPGRGFSISNPGLNPVFGSAANMGTTYTAGLAVYY